MALSLTADPPSEGSVIRFRASTARRQSSWTETEGLVKSKLACCKTALVRSAWTRTVIACTTYCTYLARVVRGKGCRRCCHAVPLTAGWSGVSFVATGCVLYTIERLLNRTARSGELVVLVPKIVFGRLGRSDHEASMNARPASARTSSHFPRCAPKTFSRQAGPAHACTASRHAPTSARGVQKCAGHLQIQPQCPRNDAEPGGPGLPKQTLQCRSHSWQCHRRGADRSSTGAPRLPTHTAYQPSGTLGCCSPSPPLRRNPCWQASRRA